VARCQIAAKSAKTVAAVAVALTGAEPPELYTSRWPGVMDPPLPAFVVRKYCVVNVAV